ncbi:MAG: hypothetical protein M3417_12970, partial [Actinomycetota bacterium]|nr:hypothetical protein [Actinomycetota bacterium]
LDLHVLPPGGSPAGRRTLPVEVEDRGALITGRDGSVILAATGRLYTRPPGGRFDDGVRVSFAVEQVALAPDGRVGIVGLEPLRFTEAGGDFGRVLVAERPAGATAFGSARRAPVPRDAFAPALAFDGASRRVVSWIRDRVTDPFEETEIGELASGVATIWAGGAPQALDRTAGDVLVAGLPAGVLVVSDGDGDGWSSAVVGPDAVRRLRGPTGRPMSVEDFAAGDLAAGPRRAVLAWAGVPDGGTRVALADVRATARRRG